jgi:Protein of unknown function (DUF3037)
MAELKQLEFFLLRYVPDAVKEEFVNIGVLVQETGSLGFSAVRITDDWSRVRCIDPEADLEVLAGLGLQLQKELQETQGWDLVLRKVHDLFSNQVQASTAKACLAEDPAKELATLVKLYLQGRPGARRVSPSGRQTILTAMRSAFESAGVLDLLRTGIRAANYTNRKGDPQSFDFAYALAAEVKFLHAVSLKTDAKIGVGLAARFPGIAKDIYEAHQAQARLTVVLEDDLDRGADEIAFAIGMMEENRIRVASAGEMPRIAAEVRRELRA